MQKENPFIYSDSNKRYYTYDYFLRKKFGKKIFKAPIDAGFTCPNIDGRCGTGGCIYCSGRGSGDFAPSPLLSVKEQYAKSAEMMQRKWKDSSGIVYFQAHTNTYAPVEKLREIYNEALEIKDAVGISIATRADCITPDIVSLLRDIDGKTFLTIELGLQSVHDTTAKRINRGHDYKTFLKGYEMLRGLNVCIHIINGLPGEDSDMMLKTAGEIAKLHPHAVKIHLLNVIKGTRLATEYLSGGFETLPLDLYTDIVIAQLETLPPDVVIGRISGDCEENMLIAPIYSRKKFVIMNEIDKKMRERNTYQGINWECFEHKS